VAVNEFENSLREMLTRRHNNTWLELGNMAVYIRIGDRVTQSREKPVRCVQIANVSTSPEHQGQGEFTFLLSEIMRITPLPVYVENVHNQRFKQALIKRGFIACRTCDGIDCDLVLVR
jgi:hypothetical protein